MGTRDWALEPELLRSPPWPPRSRDAGCRVDAVSVGDTCGGWRPASVARVVEVRTSTGPRPTGGPSPSDTGHTGTCRRRRVRVKDSSPAYPPTSPPPTPVPGVLRTRDLLSNRRGGVSPGTRPQTPEGTLNLGDVGGSEDPGGKDRCWTPTKAPSGSVGRDGEVAEVGGRGGRRPRGTGLGGRSDESGRSGPVYRSHQRG